MKKLYIFLNIIIVIISFFCICPNIKAANNDVKYHYQLEYGVNDRFLIYTLSIKRTDYARNFISIYNASNDANIVLFERNDNFLFIKNAEQENALFIEDLESYILCFLINYTQRGEGQYVIVIDTYRILANNFVNGSFEYVGTYSWVSEYINGQNLIFNVDYDSIIDTNKITLDQVITFEYLKNQFANNGVLIPDASALGQLTQGFYNNGYNAGFIAANNQGAFLKSIFSTLDSFLSISLLPGLSIGLFVAVPLVFGMVELILKFWRKD